jgi:hypothetical protein
MTKNAPVAGNRVSSIVSAPYQLALAAHHRAGLYDIARDPFVMNDTIAAFMAKVSVEGVEVGGRMDEGGGEAAARRPPESRQGEGRPSGQAVALSRPTLAHTPTLRPPCQP